MRLSKTCDAARGQHLRIRSRHSSQELYSRYTYTFFLFLLLLLPFRSARRSTTHATYTYQKNTPSCIFMSNRSLSLLNLQPQQAPSCQFVGATVSSLTHERAHMMRGMSKLVPLQRSSALLTASRPLSLNGLYPHLYHSGSLPSLVLRRGSSYISLPPHMASGVGSSPPKKTIWGTRFWHMLYPRSSE